MDVVVTAGPSNLQGWTMWLILFLLISPAMAEWKTDTIRNVTENKHVHIPWVTAKQKSNRVAAKLQIECVLKDKVPVIVTTARFSSGLLSVAYWIDDKSSEPKLLPVGNDLSSITLDSISEDELRGAKRLQVELKAAGGARLLFDFDITGIDEAMRKAC
jgi:hypothetical protein